MIVDETRFWHGCNYPWSTDGSTIYYGLDFGANIWGSHLGVSTRRSGIERDFSEMAALGFTIARWFVFADGRSGIVYDDAGLPLGLDAQFFTDMDTALQIAASVDMRLVLVLLDHRWMYGGVRDTIADPATGALLEARLPHGRAHVLHSRVGRMALFERVIDPLVMRYGRGGRRVELGDAIAAYEFMNEPDFVIDEWERDTSSHVLRPLPFEAMAQLVSRLSDVVHRYSSSFTTLGCARVRNLWAWDDETMGLDVLQLHSYPDLRRPERDPDVYGIEASALGMKRRVILGEFPGNGLEQHPPDATPPPTTLGDYLEFAVRAGYAGAWPWSFSGTDAYGRLPVDPLRRFAARHPELVNKHAFV